MKNGRVLFITLLVMLILVVFPAGFFVREYRRELANRKLIAAIKADDATRALAALRAGADPNCRDHSDDKPLSFAIHLKQLLDKALHPNVKPEPDTSITALLLSLDEDRKKDPSLIKVLLDAGAEPNLADSYGTTPIMVACRTDRLDALSLLLSCGDVSRKDSEGSSAMNYAAESDNADAILLLAQAGADVNNLDKYGRTPLHTICVNNNLEAVHTLFAYHANPNLRDKDGNTPLDFSLEFYESNSSLIKTLRKAGANTGGELDAQAANRQKL